MRSGPHPAPPRRSYYRRAQSSSRFPLCLTDSRRVAIGELDLLTRRAIQLRHRQRPVACRTLALAMLLACTRLSLRQVLDLRPDDLSQMALPSRAWEPMLFWLRWRRRLGLDLLEGLPIFCTTWISTVPQQPRYRPRPLGASNARNDVRRLGDLVSVPCTVGSLRRCDAAEEPAVPRPARVRWLRRTCTPALWRARE
jgi:hypothetical protein